MFSPYAFYFPCFLYFLPSRDFSFIQLGFSPCPQHFLQMKKKNKWKKSSVYLTCSLLVIYETSIK